MSAVDLLCEIIASQGKVAARVYRDKVGYASLAQSGLIDNDGLALSIVCYECDNFHLASVEFEENEFCYYCQEFGLISVDKSELTAISPNIPNLIEGIANAIGCKHRKTHAIYNETWRIGKLETVAGDLAIYFHPQLIDHCDYLALETALSLDRIGASHRVVLTARGVLPFPFSKTVRLADAFDIDMEVNQITLTADMFALAGIKAKSTGGRPNAYKRKLRRLIEARASSNTALPTIKGEARALIMDYETNYPNEKAPSTSTAKRYLHDFRLGSKGRQN